jgi:hypothetical protein
MTSLTLAGFFTNDPDAVAAALAYLDDPSAAPRGRKVMNADVPFAPGVRTERSGLWSEELFGPKDARDPEAWAVIELPAPILHPALAARVASALGLTEREVIAVVGGRAWITEDGRTSVPPGHPGVEAPLDTTISNWPPAPSFATLEMWRSQLGLPADPPYEPWLAEWYRARSIDQAAVTADDEKWKDDAEARTGIDALLEALRAKLGSERAEQLVVRRIPVPPVTERPLEPRPGGFYAVGDRSRVLADLLLRAQRTARLIELSAPPVIIRSERRAVQALFEDALAVWSGTERPVISLYEGDLGCSAERPPRWPIPTYHAELTSVGGLAFVDGRRALVDFSTATFEIDLETGAILQQWCSGGRSLLASLGDNLALYTGEGAWDFSCFDRATGTWLTGPLPPEVPFVFHEYFEQALLIEVATRRIHRLTDVGDYPTGIRLSPCCRYLFATDKHGGAAVFRADGERQFPIELNSYDVPVLWPDGTMKMPSDSLRWRLEGRGEEGLSAFALCESQGTWRRVQAGQLVEGIEPRFRFAVLVEAACFDRDAKTLLIAGGDELSLIALDPEPRVVRRLDLRPLYSLFLGNVPPRERPRPDALSALLYQYGTLAAAAGASIDTIAALNTASSFDEPLPIGVKRARRLSAVARGVSSVSALGPPDKSAASGRRRRGS